MAAPLRSQTRTNAAAEPMVCARKLGCRRGDRWLFDGLDLDVHAGELVWVRGSNGQGKTSLLRILAGLARAAAGGVSWRTDVSPTDEPAHRRVVYIAHANALKEDLTVAESLHFLLRIGGVDSSAAARTLALERVGLASRRDAFVRTLSQGQRRRVALARLALAQAPALWLLDEPCDALDRDGIELVDDLIRAHALAGGGCVVTSHQPLTLAVPTLTIVELGATRRSEAATPLDSVEKVFR